MEYKLFNDTYVLRLDRGEELISSIKKLCEIENIGLATIEGLGACDHVVLGLYDINQQVYHKETFDEAFEITSIIGNVTMMDDEVYLHIHINIADEDLHAYGGHLYECVISATCELFIRKINGQVIRKKDEETGLNLFNFKED